MDVIVASTRFFWMHHYEKAKNVYFDYDKNEVVVVDANGSPNRYDKNYALVSIMMR